MRSAAEQVMTLATKVTPADVMESVADKIPGCRSSIGRSVAPRPATLCRFPPARMGSPGRRTFDAGGFIPREQPAAR